MTNRFAFDIIIRQSQIGHAELAHLVERHLAKVEVASSSLVFRSICKRHNTSIVALFFFPVFQLHFRGNSNVIQTNRNTAAYYQKIQSQ